MLSVRHAIACGAFVSSLIAAGAAAAQPASTQTPPGQTPSYPQAPIVADSSMRLQVKPLDTMVFVDGYFAGIVDDFDGTFQRLHGDRASLSARRELPTPNCQFPTRLPPVQAHTRPEAHRWELGERQWLGVGSSSFYNLLPHA